VDGHIVFVSPQSCNLSFVMFPNAAIFVTMKSQSSGRYQLSHKMEISKLSARQQLAAASVTRYQPSFPYRIYCICNCFASLRCRRSMYVLGKFYRSILVSLFWGCFRLHICKYGFYKLSHNIHLPTTSFPHHIPWATGCILLDLILHHHERHFMFIHSTLLYLLDGVISEAFIYVYSV
jgi:hypothetical protein